MVLARVQLPYVVTLASLVKGQVVNDDHGSACSELAAHASVLAGVELVAVTSHSSGDRIYLPGIHPDCGSEEEPVIAPSDICRLVVSVATSTESEALIEGWFPNEWNSRLLASGNGGLSGCIDYTTLQEGTRTGFATFGTNAGHNGSTGYDLFLNKPETIEDFGHRAVHLEAELGKTLSEEYYGSKPSYAYFSGCSQGGRQGHTAAYRYPDDFDGILAGAPGVNLIPNIGAKGIWTRRTGWPNIDSPEYVRYDQMQAITRAHIELLDELDGVKDGIIDVPTSHNVDPIIFACGAGILNDTVCLSPAQIDTVRQIYQPIFDGEGELLYFAPELGTDPSQWADNVRDGELHYPYSILTDFWRGTVYNDTEWQYDDFDEADIEAAVKINPGGSNQHETDLTAFRQKGGKVLTYHGQADSAIPSSNSATYFTGVQRSVNLTLDEMDDFYRLFFIPGMFHCSGGPGAWNIGQTNLAAPDPRFNTSSNNALVALTEWVERGKSPSSIVGVKLEDDEVGGSIQAERKHCAHPSVSKWDGVGDSTDASSWNCVAPGVGSILQQV